MEIFTLLVAGLLFLLGKLIVGWYFRLNDMVDRLDRIIVLLDATEARNPQASRPRGPSPAELLEQVKAAPD